MFVARNEKSNFFRPTRKKVFLSLIPFLPILLIPISFFDISKTFPFSDLLSNFQFGIVLIIYGITLIMAFPLKPILVFLGTWDYGDGIFSLPIPNISISGMIVSAIFYFCIIYVLISFSEERKSLRKI